MLPGIKIDIDELVGIRSQLASISQARFRRRSSYRSGSRDRRVHGRGMEYEESRAYVSGDDVRTMDWRVMARTGEAYTKIFAEEKERRFLLAIDFSASMFFGTRFSFKSWTAAQVAAHLGWLASFVDDRIGGLIVAPEFHHEIRPGKGRSGLLGVFHQLTRSNLLALPPETSPGRLNFLLQELQRVVKPGSIIALISDFIGIDDRSLELLSAIARQNDLSAYWVYDDTELEPWPAGHYQVACDERIFDMDLAGAGKDAWLSEWQQQHRNRVESMAAKLDIALLPVCCNRATTPQILRHLKL